MLSKRFGARCAAVGIFLVLTMGAIGCRADEPGQEQIDARLLDAVRRGDLNACEQALNQGASIHAIDAQGNNAVLNAVEGQQPVLLRRFLEQGVDPNVRGGSGFTPLTRAAMNADLQSLHWLLAAGADPNRKNVLGNAPLHLAVQFHHPAVLDALAAAGARLDETNATGETALVVAIRHADQPAFDRLLALGANPVVRDRSGCSALFWAIYENQHDMALKLAKHGALGDTRCHDGGYTPRQLAEFLSYDDVLSALSK